MRRAAVASAVLVLALSGCGGGSSDGDGAANGETTSATGGAEGELSVAQAREAGGQVTVRGYVHVLTDPTLCNGLDTSSFPPACVGPTLKISNPAAIAAVRLEQGQGTEFARKPVLVTGTVNGDSITVDEVTTK
jgi:hypothetical protein